ncbi:MAG: DUF3616 domain-containing protein [Mariprofundaceae bacterium]|nr:DUF3616 domain-containing protein [Mariprofundaceae bacterium]
MMRVSALFLLCWGFCLSALADEQRYQGVCDASAAAIIDDSHFIVGNDGDEILSLYTTDGTTMRAIQEFDFSSYLRGNPGHESDIEDATRSGDRIYWITSHGRSKKGKLRNNRYRLFATDIAGAPPRLQLQWSGSYDRLVQDMLDVQTWNDDSVVTRETIDLIAQTTQLDEETVDDLGPKKTGLNIEALAALPNQGGLLIGFRNPLADGRALVVHLKNPDALLLNNGGRASFSKPAQIDLDGLGMRSMSYDPARKAFFIIAGPQKNKGPYKLFRWNGMHDPSPVFIRNLLSAKRSYPEALLIHGQLAQVLYDEGGRHISKRRCKTVNKDKRGFSEQWFNLDPVVGKQQK